MITLNTTSFTKLALIFSATKENDRANGYESEILGCQHFSVENEYNLQV